MTIQEFKLLPFKQQRTFTRLHGRFLATRPPQATETVKLYQMPEGFSVELASLTTAPEAQYLLAFEADSDDNRLPDYDVKLPGWMPDAE